MAGGSCTISSPIWRIPRAYITGQVSCLCFLNGINDVGRAFLTHPFKLSNLFLVREYRSPMFLQSFTQQGGDHGFADAAVSIAPAGNSCRLPGQGKRH
jgi:hypothetical protein